MLTIEDRIRNQYAEQKAELALAQENKQIRNMIIQNPSDQDATIILNGKELSVKAGGSCPVSEEEGMAWTKVHGFLKLSNKVMEAPKVEEKAKEVKVEKEVIKDKAK